jgi:hypothetical protein
VTIISNTLYSSEVWSSSLGYAIGRVQQNKEGLKLNGTHQLLAYAGDINVVGENIDTIQKNTGSSIRC